jgi:hypothetical protein
LEVDADYSQQTFKHILVPVWLLAYDYHGKTYQVVVNGYTGTIAGYYPKSWTKILLLVLTILAIIGGIAFLNSRSHAGNRVNPPAPSGQNFPIEQY